MEERVLEGYLENVVLFVLQELHSYTYKELSSPIFQSLSFSKGTFQKRFSGFCPLRGGEGVPPNSVKEKNLLFFHTDFPLRKKSAKTRLFLAKKR